eukprot:TRINITY_DN560_c0_g1_i1.p1 TRINITY_DN560_c0_g1~~TRINITY_DN560_c0_g1_i1.p1  ORF type:complete len:360 (+),score=111.41 TRINITY_DN560_c0_g1_i1:64-1143(+)
MRSSSKMAIDVEAQKEEMVSKPPPPSATKQPTLFGIEMRHIVLPLLTLQNAGAVLLMRAVRSLPGETEFATQTVVIMQEVFKLVACVFLLLYTGEPISNAWNRPNEALKTGVPAILYLFQNNVQYLAVGILDVATYTVSYQSKTIWTGILSILMLGRTLGLNKWTGIILLVGGISAVNLGGSNKSEAAAERTFTASERMFGLVLINAAAVASALAGVSFEKLLKGVSVSLWTRNMQLAFYSIFTGLLVLYTTAEQREQVVAKGFFHGYTPKTWMCVCANAFGGLLVGATIKYADAVSKDISIGASIVLSTLMSTSLFGYQLSSMVMGGIVAVIYSVFIYSGNARNPIESCVGGDPKQSN